MKVGKVERNGKMVDCRVLSEGETTYRVRIAIYCNGRYNGSEEFTVPKEKVVLMGGKQK